LSAPSQLRPNWLSRLPAGLKLALALGIIIGTVLMPPQICGWFIAVSVLLVLAIFCAGLSWAYLMKRLLWLSPFILVVAVTNMFQSGTRIPWQAVALKSGLSLVTIIVLIHTTSFSAILRTLQALRVPGLLVTTMVLMQRYLFVLSDEAMRMRRARASRTFSRGRRFEWQVLSSVVGQLFLRASDRAERIYNAMCSRGWK
jgi:cobalt/nickel transport system permease protein